MVLVRFVTGCSWEDAERLCGSKVSDTAVRKRRGEWICAGVFDVIVNETLSAYDRVIRLELADVALDGSLQKSPCGGEGTGKNPTDRSKLDQVQITLQPVATPFSGRFRRVSYSAVIRDYADNSARMV